MSEKRIETRDAIRPYFRRKVFYIAEGAQNSVTLAKVCAVEQAHYEGQGYAEPLLEFDAALVRIEDLPMVQYAHAQAIALAHEWNAETEAFNPLATSQDLIQGLKL